MRPIHVVGLDKRRPAVILTRETLRDRLLRITVAPITSTIRGLASEVPVGPENGLELRSVVSIDNISTVSRGEIGPQVGWFLDDQEAALTRALAYAFDLDIDL